MRKFLALVALGWAAWASPAGAAPPQYQTNIPGVIAPGEVPLACDANAANCAPASAANPLSVASGGNVASGTADAGNPVKVGGVINPSPPLLTSGLRADLQMGSRGQVLISQFASSFSMPDGAGNANFTPQRPDGLAPMYTPTFGFVFNGTNWDRARGDATGGAWAQGNVASGTADAGNPVKVGGVYNPTLPILSSGQRSDFQTDSRGNLNVSIHGVGIASSDGISNNNIISIQSYATQSGGNAPLLIAGTIFNGLSWDRLKKPNSVARIVSSTAGTNATIGKAGPGDLFHITGQNVVASARYLKIYNKSSAPTVGTDAPFATYYMAANSQFDVAFDTPLYFSTGIAFAITAGANDNDATAISAGDIVALNLVYQ